ncbi:ABC transporter substrate-binding protein [Williamsia sterculiae]|uniref:Peptide/nickel transport system substrate-binding protein n=1 Tax=Williamsia sterculiae TaxID=1344003 RepID=A0A1N7EH46_9NOCA|nr:ABC transporter substrate-binding protein [Williamsia sterculiae]SIR87329.1 peptide/nickel transport system substrate-binding protein [Williamsia sterculiae]
MTLRRLALALLATGSVATTIAGCSSDSPSPSVDYLIDGAVTTYNANTVEGGRSGALMAWNRVLPGFSYLGPDGSNVADTDVGTVSEVLGDQQTLRYQFSDKAVFSDGKPMDCDDLVLAWAAQSGRFEGFTPATTAGYRDIESVDCDPGQKSATVTFAKGRDYRDWRGLFGAGTLLPAHQAAAAAGVPDVVAPIRNRNTGAVARIAKFWNTGWSLTPGSIDPARNPASKYPSSGPYKLESYSATDGLVLVANDKWWGDKPTEPRITVWPRGTDGAQRLSAGQIDVMDTGRGTYGSGSVNQTPSSSAPPVNGATEGRPTSTGVERLVMSTSGPLADPNVRRALAACLPRDQLAQTAGTAISNLHLLGAGDLVAATLNGEFGADAQRADVDKARALLKTAGRTAPVAVRIGYPGPDQRRAQTVSQIASSCAGAGFRIQDAAFTGSEPALEAVLTGSGDDFAASGAADPTRDSYALYAGDPANVGRYDDKGVADGIDELAVTSDGQTRTTRLRDLEKTLWDQMPSVPLFVSPREVQWRSGVGNVVAASGRNGAGWNMDRWELR